jgi:hypothetical protein
MAKGDITRKLAEWMRGRNGSDELGAFAMVIAFILLVLNIFLHTLFINIVAIALMGYAWWRMCSKNVAARRRENEAFTRLLGPVAPWVRNPPAALREHKEYRHLVCPKCKQRVRVPRGKGKLRVKCPKCQEKFDART